jgi:hypothetical protein
MSECHFLDEHLRSARIVETLPVAGGGGHPEKRRLVLDGGVILIAKPRFDEPTAHQVAGELAACILARELVWDIVPATILRPNVELVSGGRVADCSVQIIWSGFKTAFELGIGPGNCQSDASWRVALFDVLIRNTDRKSDNWGMVGDSEVVRLFDNGNAHGGPGSGFNSEFAAHYNGQPIPEHPLQDLRRFVARREWEASLLSSVLPQSSVEAVFSRAERLIAEGTLAPPQE